VVQLSFISAVFGLLFFPILYVALLLKELYLFAFHRLERC
jgi:hypothetical protein